MVPFTLSARIICRCSGLCFQLGVQRCSELRRVKYWELCVLFTLTVKVRTPCWCSVSVMSEFASPWTAACQASLSFTISWSLLKFMSTEMVMPSNHLTLCHPLLPSVFPSIRVFSSKSALHIRWPKYRSFSFSIILSNEDSGLTPFTVDYFHLFAAQDNLKSLLQPHSLGPALTCVRDYWKNRSIYYTDLCCQSDISAF